MKIIYDFVWYIMLDSYGYTIVSLISPIALIYDIAGYLEDFMRGYTV